ncbi:MAG: tetratricopeptide repeat protein [Deferribacteres bacterium]|nr:tetratricopeptide repeat protein [Deferribacteres bacterium]
MKTMAGRHVVLMMALIGLMLLSSVCYAKEARVFSLEDINGRKYDLSGMKQKRMLILYFFDVESGPSQEGLLNLNQLAKKYADADLTVWAVTASPREKVADFVKKTAIAFPVLLDDSDVSSRYNARLVLPVVYVIGPGLKILDHFEGGGKATEMMLLRVAERELQQKNTLIAKAISEEIIRKNPRNIRAKTLRGYAAMKENNLPEAEKVFRSLLTAGSNGEIAGKEGLAAVYARKQETEKALRLIEEVEQKAPERAFPHVIKGDILYARNKKKEAEEEYRQAVQKKSAAPYHDAVRYNQLGRVYANSGDYLKARELYDRAVSIDPYYIEGTTNKGLTYAKEGRWDKALETYRKALALDSKDTFAAALAKRAAEMLSLQKDAERRKRIDKLVSDLAERFRNRKKAVAGSEDGWTSPPMVISFVDFREAGGLAERDGLSTVLMTQLADYLNASGRVRVVERVVIDRLLEELNLGSSDLADPETALRLGRILAARLIGTGSIFYLPQTTLLNLRLIDTETSAIPQVITRPIDTGASLEKELFRINREILRTVISKYPLRGYIVKGAGNDRFIVNLGSRQGVVPGTKFNVLEEQEPIKYKGKTLRSAPRHVALLEVVGVEPDLCFVRVISSQRPVRADDKVQEKIEEAAL